MKRTALVIFLMFVFQCGVSHASRPVAVQGVLDLTGWDFHTMGGVPLAGEWEFYWQQLIPPEDFPDLKAEAQFVGVPKSWRGRVIDGHPLGGHGFATYRLKLLLDDSTLLAFHLPYTQTAYRLWVNGQLVSANGTVAASPDGARPQYLSTVAPLPPDEKSIDIVLQISNFHFREGGLVQSPKLDIHQRLRLDIQRQRMITALLFGCSMMMALYHFALYGWRRDSKADLCFAVLTLIFSIRIAVTGAQLLPNLFPATPWALHLKLEYLTGYLGPLFFMLFLQSLFPNGIAPLVIRVWAITAIVGSVITVTAGVHLASLLIPGYQVLLILLIVYLMYAAVRAVIRSEQGTLFLFIGIVAFLLTGVLAVLYYNGFLKIYDPIPYGLFALLLSQTLLLAQRSSMEFHRKEALLVDNATLLETSRQQLGQLKTFRKHMAERDERVRRQIADMLHGRTQARLLQAWAKAGQAGQYLSDNPDKARDLMKQVQETIDLVREEDIRQASHQLHPSATAAGLIPALDSLLGRYQETHDVYWTVSPELESLDDPVNGRLRHAVKFGIYRIAEEALNNVARHAKASTLWICLQTAEEGVFDVEHHENRHLEFVVRDNGVGFDTGGLNQGLGLQSIAALVDDLHGTHTVESEHGKGTTITITVPL